MKFESLKEKCEYYRSLSDTRLIPNMPVLIMLDGHCFSKIIKNNYKLPFDDTFISLMDETAKHVCSRIQGAIFAYTQSDEISIFVKDYISPESDAFFGYRTCKLLSLVAAEATAFFNRRLFEIILSNSSNVGTAKELLSKTTLATFDCKAWNVPTSNDVFAWFLYRQNDCVRNSKQQFAQTYLPHKELMGKIVDEQIEMVKNKLGYDWHNCDDGKKYGRIIVREFTHCKKEINGKEIEFDRNAFKASYAWDLNLNPDKLRNLIG